MEDRPMGWRPFTDEQRQNFASQGFDEAAIAQFEERNVYRPNTDAVLGIHFAMALLDVVARRHGPTVIADFRTVLEKQAGRLEAGNVEEQVDAHILRTAMAEDIDWDSLTARASDPDHPRWTDAESGSPRG